MQRYISLLLYFSIFLFSILSVNAQWSGSVTFCCNKYLDDFGDSCAFGTFGCNFVFENCGTSSCPLQSTIGAFSCSPGLVNGRAEANCKYTCPDGTEADSPAACDQTPQTGTPPTDTCPTGSTDPACLTCDPSFASCTTIDPVCTGAGCYTCSSGGSDSVSGAACVTVDTPQSSACFKTTDQTSNGFGCVKYEKNIWVSSQCNIAEEYCRGGVSEPDGSGGIQCKDDGDPTTDDGSVQTKCVANGTGLSSPNVIACSTYSNSACGGGGWRCIPDTYCTASTITWETVCNAPAGLTGYLDGFVTGTCQFCNSVNGRSNVQCSNSLPVNPGLTGYTVTGSPVPNNVPPVGKVVKNSPVVCTQDIYSATISGTGNRCSLPQKMLNFKVTCTSGIDPRENLSWGISHEPRVTCTQTKNTGTLVQYACSKEYNGAGSDIVRYTVSDGGSYIEQSYWSNNEAGAQTFSGQVSVVYDVDPPEMTLSLTTTKSNEITATFGATDVHLVEHQYYCGGVADAGNSSYPYITIQDNDQNKTSLGNQFSSIVGVNNNCDDNIAAVALNESPRIVNRQFSSTIDNRDVQYTFNTVLTSRDDPFTILFDTGNQNWYAQDSFCNRSYATNPQDMKVGAPWMQTDGSVYIYGDSKSINANDKKTAVQLSIPKVDSSADTFLSKYFFLSNNPSTKLAPDKNSLSKYNLKITKTPNYLLSAYESTSTQYQTYFDEMVDRIFQDVKRPENEFISNTNITQLFEHNGDISIGDTDDIVQYILDNMPINSNKIYANNKFESYSSTFLDKTKKTAIIINGNLELSSSSAAIKYEGVNYILVRGNLTIDSDILKNSANSALQFVVQGDLFIKGGINHSLNLTRNDIPRYDTIQAFFLVDGRVHTYRDNPDGKQIVWDGLNIQGSIVTGQLCPNDRVTLWGETGPINTNEGFYKGEGKAVDMQSNKEPCISHFERDFIMIHNLSYPAQLISFDPTAYLLLNSGIKQYSHTRIIEDAWDGR